MRAVDRLADCIGGALGKQVRLAGDELCELRIRAGQRARLRMLNGRSLVGEAVSAGELWNMVARLCGDSLYACEDELRRGYFTMAGGLRVGVCGRASAGEAGVRSIGSIGSVCVRIPREVRGCADRLLGEKLESLLILSPPGLGKTTLVRELARTASNRGWNVAIADERREIAACVEGVPTFDVGPCTDVMDGCPKGVAISMLVRACAPDLIIADEIGGEGDARALMDAVRCGVDVIATAHAAGFDEAYLRFGDLFDAGVFQRAVLLGPTPGRIREVRTLSAEGGNNAEGLADGCDAVCLRGCGKGTVQWKEAQGRAAL